MSKIGSVYKLNDKKKRKKKWIALGWNDDDGKRHCLGLYRTKAEANRALKKHIEEKKYMGLKTLEDIYLEWLPVYKKQISEKKYRYLYLYDCEKAWKFCYPLYTTFISSITVDDIKNLLLTAHYFDENGNKKEIKKTSYVSYKKIKTLLNKVFIFAVSNQYIDHNIIDDFYLSEIGIYKKGKSPFA